VKVNRKYLKMNVEQGSNEWKAMRLNHVTASNVPCIFDKSPYKTRLQYFEELSTKSERTSPVFQKVLELGHATEVIGRKYVTETYGMTFDPAVVISTRLPALLASLDGFNESENLVFESKYVGEEVLKGVREKVLPEHHHYQVQAQLLATGAERCIYFARAPSGEAAVLESLPDNEVIDSIAERVAAFMEMVKSGNAPEPGAKDWIDVNDPEFDELYRLKLISDSASDAYDEMKKSLDKRYTDQQRIRAGSMQMYRSLVKGSIPYSTLKEVKSLDLEKYRAKPRLQVTFKPIKSKE